MRRQPRGGFTLVELLVVVGIIVTMLAVGIPTFSALIGTKSQDAAINQVSAMLGRARARAIGLQRNIGVIFYVNPRTQRTVMGLVDHPETATTLDPDWIDLVPDADLEQLPTAVGVQFVNNHLAGSAGADRYVRQPGVIMFDGRGHQVCTPFRIRAGGALAATERLGKFMGSADFAPTGGAMTHLGFVVYDAEAFKGAGFTDEDRAYTSTAQADTDEETWLDTNGTPLLINRYNGTTVRGQ